MTDDVPALKYLTLYFQVTGVLDLFFEESTNDLDSILSIIDKLNTERICKLSQKIIDIVDTVC